MTGKAANKAALQKLVGLPARKSVPLYGTISRLAEQKGVDIQLAALEEMLNADIQFVQLGSGSPEFESAYRALAVRFPTKVAVRFGYNESLAHRIEAGCDFFLMPSRFEPCGLNQMYSLRYGTIPIVRAVGGLDDSIVDFNESAKLANGVKFFEYSARALTKAIHKSLAVYGETGLFNRYRRNGMKQDFSWGTTVGSYSSTYQSIVHHPQG